MMKGNNSLVYFLFVIVNLLIVPLLVIARPSGNVKSKSESANTSHPVEEIIAEKALKLDNKLNFGPESTKLIQKYNSTTSKTEYHISECRIIKELSTNGKKDIGKMVIVTQDKNRDDFDDIFMTSDDHTQRSFTVLKLDEKNKKEKSYWIFIAFLRKATSQDAKSNIIDTKGSKMVIEWGSWDEDFGLLFLNLNRTAESPHEVVPKGRSMSKATAITLPKAKGKTSGAKNSLVVSKGKTMSKVTAVTLPKAQGKNSGAKNASVKPKGRGVTLARPAEDTTEDPMFAGSKSGSSEEAGRIGRGRNAADNSEDQKQEIEELHAARVAKQAARFEEMKKNSQSQPPYIDLISSSQDIYAHVRWYGDYFDDTIIETKADLKNYFSANSFGKCAQKDQAGNIGILASATATRDIVEFFSSLLRDYCKPSAIAAYNKLFEDGYLALNPDRSIDIVKDNNKLLKKKVLTISEMDQLQRMFIIAAYSQVYMSVTNFPVEPIDGGTVVIETRVFILINTAMHIQDLMVHLAVHHYKTIANGIILKLKPIAQKLLCEYRLFRAKDKQLKNQKSRIRYSAIAVLILLEQIGLTLKKPGFVTENFEAHVYFESLYSKPYNLLAKYKKKIDDIKKNIGYRNQCSASGNTD